MSNDTFIDCCHCNGTGKVIVSKEPLATTSEIDEAIQRATEWACSAEGRQAIQEASDRSMAFAEELRRSLIPSWEDMHRPFTI